MPHRDGGKGLHLGVLELLDVPRCCSGENIYLSSEASSPELMAPGTGEGAKEFVLAKCHDSGISTYGNAIPFVLG